MISVTVLCVCSRALHLQNVLPPAIRSVSACVMEVPSGIPAGDQQADGAARGEAARKAGGENDDVFGHQHADHAGRQTQNQRNQPPFVRRAQKYGDQCSHRKAADKAVKEDADLIELEGQ